MFPYRNKTKKLKMSNTAVRVLAVLIMLLQATVIVHAQKASAIDSLRNNLSKAENTTRIDILFQLSMKYQHFKPDSAMYFAEMAFKEAKKLDYLKGQGDALISIGRLKRDKGDYSQALDDIFSSLKIYEDIKDSIQIGNALNDISIVYAYSQDNNQSLVYFKKALNIFQQIGDEKGESQALNNIGLIYLELKDFEKAEEYMLRSLAIKKKRNDLMDISSGYANLGSIMEETGQESKALRYYLQANELFLQTNNKTGLAKNHLAIARLELNNGVLSDARKHALAGFRIAMNINSKPFMEEASSLLVDIAELNEDFETAFKYLRINSVLKDSLFNESNARHLEELKARFNAEENLREIALLKKDQEIQKATMRQKDILTYSLIAGIFLTLVILVLVYVAYRANWKKKELLSFKNTKIRSQKEDLIRLNRDKDQLFSIISHDIKGPLNSLKGFSHLLIHHVERLSQDEIREMGSQVNQSLENLNELLDNLLAWSIRQSGQAKLNIQEISINELIRKNIELYKLTASAKQIELVDNSDDNIIAEADYNSIHTVLRNLVSNALKFSYPNSEVIISARYEEDKVKVSVADQGIGMSKEAKSKLFRIEKKESQKGTSNEKGSGFGLVLCQELIKENNGMLTVRSEVRMGSEFIFTLPTASSN